MRKRTLMILSVVLFFAALAGALLYFVYDNFDKFYKRMDEIGGP